MNKIVLIRLISPIVLVIGLIGLHLIDIAWNLSIWNINSDCVLGFCMGIRVWHDLGCIFILLSLMILFIMLTMWWSWWK